MAQVRVSEFVYENADAFCSSGYILPFIIDSVGHLPAKSVVADLGCGNGSMLGQLRQYQWELHGVEISRSGLSEGTLAYPEIEFSHADLTSDLSSHPLAGRCDVVISTEVIEHVLLPRAYARNCYRFLKPKGVLIISTPYHGYLKNVVLAVSGRLDSHFTALWDYGHIKFWSRRTLTVLLEETGFVIERFRGVGRVPWLWKSMIIAATKPESLV